MITWSVTIMTVTEFHAWYDCIKDIVEIAFFHEDTYTKFTVQKDMFVKAIKDTFNVEVC